jgi:hypothetical protein
MYNHNLFNLSLFSFVSNIVSMKIIVKCIDETQGHAYNDTIVVKLRNTHVSLIHAGYNMP